MTESEEPVKLLSIEAMDQILRDTIPIVIKTKGVSEYTFNELHTLATIVGILQDAMRSFDDMFKAMELRLTELESRVLVLTSRVKGEEV